MEFTTYSGELKFKDTNLESLKEVRRFDKNGELIEVIIAERLTDDQIYNKRTYGEKLCKVCGLEFTLSKLTQKTCGECIKKRPMAGVSFRRVPLKSEKLKGVHPDDDTEIQEGIQVPASE